MEADLKAGAELDALVAEKFFGLNVLGMAPCYYWQDGMGYFISKRDGDDGTTLRPVYLDDRTDDCSAWHQPSHLWEDEHLVFGHHSVCLEVVLDYSTNWSDVRAVIEKIIEGDGTQFFLEYRPTQYWPNEAEPEEPSRRWRASCGLSGTDMCWSEAMAATPELAICLLALKLVGVIER